MSLASKEIDEASVRILLIEDDEVFCQRFIQAGIRYGFHTSSCRSFEEARQFLSSQSFSFYLVDANLDNDHNFGLTQSIISKNPLARIYSIVKLQSLNLIPRCLDQGISNVIPICIDVEDIATWISHDSVDHSSLFHSDAMRDIKLVGRSQHHFEILEKIDQMKNVDASVLITGESGTGKELVARALHESSHRSSQRFDAINCGAIPENLLESELFGHRRGAFTDAKSDKKGLFELCHKGTLLLDEIGELPLNLQVKLLRVLQEKEIRPIGGVSSIKIDTRIIAVTNRDLQSEIERGHFRGDLYYRLSVLKVHILPLRSRSHDIPVLAVNFLNKFSHQHHKPLQPFTPSQLARIQNYSWYGNVRELQNAIERSVILAKNQKVSLNDIFDDHARLLQCSKSQGIASDESMPVKYSEAKESFERRYLNQILKLTQGNVSEAARLAGKTRVEIYRYLMRNKINPTYFRI